MKILVTAFEPFGGNVQNSSWEVAQLLPDHIGSSIIVKGMLPVDFMDARKELRSLIDLHLPDVVLSLGQSSKFEGLSIERVALNLMDSIKPDNAGHAPTNEPIHPDGDTAYMTAIPVRLMADACNRKGIAAKVSNSAGTYVCNSVYYEALYAIARQRLPLRALFIHLPHIPEQEKSPMVAKERLAEGISEIIFQLEGIYGKAKRRGSNVGRSSIRRSRMHRRAGL